MDSLFTRRAVPASESAYLRRSAAHPAHAEFATVARARAADILSARYELPFGPRITMVNLPTPRWGNLRDGARAHLAVAGEVRWTVDAGLRAMPRIVLDSTQAKGLRWEFFEWTSVFAPCASIKTLAFGPGEDYAAWLDSARRGLVRRPSDKALTELMLKRPFGTGRCLSLWGGLRTVGRMR